MVAEQTVRGGKTLTLFDVYLMVYTVYALI
jgi:hypothetical protein